MGILLVYDVTDEKSFGSTHTSLSFTSSLSGTVDVVVCGNGLVPRVQRMVTHLGGGWLALVV